MTECAHWIGAEQRRCGARPARLYLPGHRCPAHTPAALAGKPEPSGQYCAPNRCLCGHPNCPTRTPRDTDAVGQQANPRLTAALDYATRGWPVFPCLPDAKVPGTHHGFKDATTDPGQIRRWWEHTPTANIGIVTGAPGPDVLDVDVKPDGNGWAAFNTLKRAGLLKGATTLVRTRSGGLHAYYTGTTQRCGSVPKRFIDFKATGGYVIAPPSTVGDKPYEVIEHREAAGTLDWAKAKQILDPPRQPARPPQGAGSGGVDALAAWLSGQQDGNRNRALFWAANRAVEHGYRGGDLEPLVQAAIATGLNERAARNTIRSAERTAGGGR